MAINPVQFSRVDIPFEKVLARLGYARGKTRLDKKTEDEIREGIAVAEKLIAAKQAVASAPVVLRSQTAVYLEPGFLLVSGSIRDLLKDCVAAAGFVVTVGPGIEEKRNRCLAEKETTRALILDAAGSVAAEELAAKTHARIAAEAAGEKREATRRFSPGFGDWALSGQKDFLDWLGAKEIGIRLTEYFQMLPEKSVSAIIGLKKFC